NGRTGLEIFGAGTSGNLVLGNLIGTDATGTAKLGNGSGVYIEGGATFNTIGGMATANSTGAITSPSANLMSGNNTYGLVLNGTGTSGNVVLGNAIGTDRTGTAALGNANDGVLIFQGATANTIGGVAVAN